VFYFPEWTHACHRPEREREREGGGHFDRYLDHRYIVFQTEVYSSVTRVNPIDLPKFHVRRIFASVSSGTLNRRHGLFATVLALFAGHYSLMRHLIFRFTCDSALRAFPPLLPDMKR